MRLAPLLALLLAAPALHAQCTPDPVPPSEYYPLAVGNEWIYHAPAFASSPEAYVQRRILRTDAVGQAVEQTCTVSVGTRTRTCSPERVATFPDGLGAPLGTSPLGTCADDLGTSVTIGGTAYTVARVKGLGGYIDFPPPPFAAGIGPIGIQVGNLVERTDRFEYARVGGVEYGTRPAGVPTPDLTPPQDYYPLEVGNEWIYHYTENSVYGVADTYERRRVLREETVDGLVYAVDQTCTLNLRDAAPGWACGTERRLRFDPATTDVVQSIAPGVTDVLFCRLGADFGAPLPDGCDGVAYVEVPQAILIGGVEYQVARTKRLATLANVGPAAFIAGIGPAERPVGAFQTSTFEFARVRGVEYGVRPAVAGEAGAPSAGALALTAAPNPTSGALRLTLAVPALETVTVEAFDALGRRVWQQQATLAAATLVVVVDASAWAPGVYVVRATAGAAMATARVVRQ